MLGWCRKILWSFAACLGLWFAGMVWFASQIHGNEAHDLPAADAIVILTGGKGRLEYGLRLLADGKGEKLFISGAGKKVTLADIVDLSPPDIRDTIRALPPGAIELGRQAENTIGNAEETARWARNHGFKRLLMVTANYHMPRGVSEFREIMPDIILIPAPVFPRDASLAMLLLEYHKYLAGKLRHWLVAVL